MALRQARAVRSRQRRVPADRYDGTDLTFTGRLYLVRQRRDRKLAERLGVALHSARETARPPAAAPRLGQGSGVACAARGNIRPPGRSRLPVITLRTSLAHDVEGSELLLMRARLGRRRFPSMRRRIRARSAGRSPRSIPVRAAVPSGAKGSTRFRTSSSPATCGVEVAKIGQRSRRRSPTPSRAGRTRRSQDG